MSFWMQNRENSVFQLQMDTVETYVDGITRSRRKSDTDVIFPHEGRDVLTRNEQEKVMHLLDQDWEEPFHSFEEDPQFREGHSCVSRTALSVLVADSTTKLDQATPSSRTRRG
eukprot:c9790_g1_i2.p2 GENE.c9790_g1_i2~~c9790_g1_i2.p2  ORF type:complete len:113 (-),score=9.17 c9790_g1_i2:594-932(-)